MCDDGKVVSSQPDAATTAAADVSIYCLDDVNAEGVQALVSLI